MTQVFFFSKPKILDGNGNGEISNVRLMKSDYVEHKSIITSFCRIGTRSFEDEKQKEF